MVSRQTVHSHYEEIVDACQCAHDVIGAYYPIAMYCNKQLFIAHG